jgi:hypothetical protein
MALRPVAPTLAPVRRIATALLVLLAAVLPAVAVVSWWAYGEATDTARFMRTAAPLATDHEVQRRVADELVAAADRRLGGVAAVVPGGLDAARAQVRTIADGLAGSPAYRHAWFTIQRSAHARLATRLDGGTGTPLRLDLRTVADVLRAQVTAAGLPQVAAAIPDPAPVTIADRAQVRRARQAADAVRAVRAIAIPGAVLALLGVLLTAGRLSTGLRRVAGCLAVSALLLVAGRYVARDAIAGQGTAGDVAVAVFDVLIRPLRPWVVGAGIAAVVAGLTGVVLGASERRRRVA